MGSKQEALDLGLLDSFIGYKLRRAQLAFFADFTTSCADLGLTPGLFSVMEVVNSNPGCSQSSVAAALGNDRSAMVFAVDKLEKLGYVERRKCEEDRRSHALCLTDLGKTIQRKANKRIAQHEAKFSAVLHHNEKKQLISILERFAEVANT